MMRWSPSKDGPMNTSMGDKSSARGESMIVDVHVVIAVILLKDS